MPNHVTNELYCTNVEVIEALRSDERIVDFNSVIPQPENMHRGMLSSEDMARNPNNWYTFNIDNWGTKWNAYDVEHVDRNTVRFDTAWSTPFPIFVALSRMFPENEIEVTYADEDLGSNMGTFTLLDGELTSSSLNEDIDSDYDKRAEWACQFIHGSSLSAVYGEDYWD